MIRLSAERYHPDQPFSDRWPYIVTTDIPMLEVDDVILKLIEAGVQGVVIAQNDFVCDDDPIIVRAWSYEMARRVMAVLSGAPPPVGPFSEGFMSLLSDRVRP